MRSMRSLAIKLHRFSVIVIFAFVLVHLLNHFLLFRGAEVHIQLMENLRKIYHQPILWRLLLYSIIIQMLTGVINLRWKNFKSKNVQTRLQSIAGVYLLFFLLVHIAAIHNGRFVGEIDTNIYFATVGYRSFPAALFFYPYYFFAVLAFFVHMASAAYFIVRRKYGRDGISLFYAIMFFGLIIAAFLTASLSGLLVDFDIPDLY